MLSECQSPPPSTGVLDSALLLGNADQLLRTDPGRAQAYISYVLETLDAAEGAALRAQAEVQAADVALRLGQVEAALAHLEALATLPPQPPTQARAQRIRAQALLMSGAPDDAHHALNLAVETASSTGQHDVQADALCVRAQIEHGRGESGAALVTLGQVRTLRGSIGDVSGEIGAICNCALILIALGRGAEALELLHHALERLPQSATPLASERHVHSNLGLLLEGMGRFEEAASHYLRAREAASAAQDHAAHATLSLNAGEIARKLGRPDAAELLTAASLAARELGLMLVQGGALHSLGLLCTSQGEYEQAELHLAQAEEIAQHSGNLDAQLEAMLGRARNWLVTAQSARARPLLLQVLSLAQEGERPQHVLDAHLLLADAYEADEPRTSLRHLRSAAALEREQRAVALAEQAHGLATEALLKSARLEAEHERQLRAISEQARAEAESTVQAQVLELERGRLYDSLTGLPNRLLLRVLIGQDIREHQVHSLAVLDFDRLGELQETLGVAAADELLVQVAARLQGQLSAGETLARLGSDVFALILRGSQEPARVLRRARTLLGAFTAEFCVADAEVVIGASMGIAHFPEHAQDADDLLRAAHVAVREAKDAAGIQIYSTRHSGPAGRSAALSLESGLARALERNEFELHFQPLVEAVGGRVVTAEALLRWDSALLGRRSPAEFIPVLERNGLIVPVGEWVLREACRQAAGWAGVRVAVNLSARQFLGGDLVESVFRALAESGLPPERLELEITESLMMQSPERAMRLLHDLKRTGVRVMLDDFGTGYSNLSYLHAFPLDGLKIDRSFVVALDQGVRAGGVIEAIVQMGRTLGLDVVAEGIETAGQHRALAALGVPVLQGYLFGRPRADWRP